jgi:hypothetical protein
MTPEEWVAHSKKVRAEMQAARGGPRVKEIGEKGVDVLKQMAKLGIGLKSGSAPAEPEPETGEDGEEEPPF